MKRLFAIFTLTLVVVISEQQSGCAAPNSPPAENGVIAVPEGGPDVLVPFIQNLLKQRPRTPEELAKMREAVLKAAEKILASQPNPSQLLFAVQAKAAMLNNLQELSAFEDALRKLGNDAAVRVVQARILFIKLEQARNNLPAFRKLLDEAEKFLREGKLQPAEIELALHIGELAEQTGDSQLAGEAYEKMAELLKARPELSPAVRQLTGRARRCKLPGNPMHLEGKTLDGQDLDWGKYRGKVVLVDFWATWCGPCRAEIKNIKEVYEKYHDRGFEVVGISVDTMGREQLLEFVKKEGIPWTICRDKDSPNSMAEYYGITGIPQMILVGREGKVISLHARGPALATLVEKALGAQGDSAHNPPAKPTEKKADADSERAQAEKREVLKQKRQAELQANAPQPRAWTDVSGKFHVTATFRGMINNVVKLETEDGRTISVPLEKLSEEDQEYIRRRKR